MYKVFKRVLDFVGAFLLLIIASPFMVIAALAIKISDGGKIIFTQERPGKDCKIFNVYKFRTMSEKFSENGRTLSDMERMTKVGRFLRKTSIDELPQLFNILKGEMSFIGPRPLLVRYLPYYTKEQNRRHEVTPGISGWAQVNGRNAVSWEKRFEMDVWYVENMSFLLDMRIVFLTIKKVFAREGINVSENNTMTFFDEEVKKARGEKL